MSKKNIIILTISVIILILAIGVFVYAKSLNTSKGDDTSNSVSKEDLQSKEEFYFYDEESNILDLKNFSEKPIIMLFWKSDDPKAYDVIELLEKYNEEYQDDLYIFGVNVNEPDLDLEIVRNVKAAQFKIPMYFDTDLTSKDEYKYSSLPHLVFIDKDGTTANEISGGITEDQLNANIDLLLNY